MIWGVFQELLSHIYQAKETVWWDQQNGTKSVMIFGVSFRTCPLTSTQWRKQPTATWWESWARSTRVSSSAERVVLARCVFQSICGSVLCKHCELLLSPCKRLKLVKINSFNPILYMLSTNAVCLMRRIKTIVKVKQKVRNWRYRNWLDPWMDLLLFLSAQCMHWILLTPVLVVLFFLLCFFKRLGSKQIGRTHLKKLV